MGLYSGFNALGLGQATNAMYEQKRARGNDLLKLISQFGHSVADRNDEERRKAALLESARGMGVDNVEGLSEGMNADELARYLQGISAARESEKLADARQKKQWGREDLLRSDDRAYSEKQKGMQWEREDKVRDDERRYNEGQEAKKRSQEALDKGFATLSQAYLADITKMKDNLLPSQKDLDESARIQGDLMNFVKKHPEYGVELAMSIMQAGEGMKTVPTIESRFADLDAVMKNGVVDPKAMQALKERLINENVWAALNENKDFVAKWNLLAGKVGGDKLTRDALMLGSGSSKTEGDARREKDKADTDALKAAEKKKMLGWYSSKDPNEGPYDFSNAEALGIEIPSDYKRLNERRSRRNGKK